MGDPTIASANRRRFLSGKVAPPVPDRPVSRPPWSSAASIERACTGCAACIGACPERILSAGVNGHPEVSFASAECTFCQACVQACPEPVFDLSQVVPWSLKVSIADTCLLNKGVTCQLCTDPCDAQALRFDARQAPAGQIQIDLDACTGCGACVSNCPVTSISVLNRETVTT